MRESKKTNLLRVEKWEFTSACINNQGVLSWPTKKVDSERISCQIQHVHPLLIFFSRYLEPFESSEKRNEKEMASFTVTLSGGAPWGFSMAGGIDFNQPLNVSKVTSGGKAALKGIRPGLCILQVSALDD